MKPVIVLVRSKYPRNVGMVSRAMANFGVDKLCLIDPQCTLDNEAREGAAQAQGPLAESTIYPDWETFLSSEPEGLRLGFSRRDGRRRESFSMSESSQWLESHENPLVYLVFGPEDHGLAAADLDLLHRTCDFELQGSMKSMNLSHAVLHVLSRWESLISPLVKTDEVLLSEDLTSFDLEKTLKLWLEALNFDLSQQRWNALIALKQMIMKSAPTHQELALFDSIVQQTRRRLQQGSHAE